MTVEELSAKLVELDKGVLYRGAHQVGTKEFCVLEFRRAVLHQSHSDTPDDFLDLRALNDAPWSSDTVRTTHLLPVLAALWDWPTWDIKIQRDWATRVALETVRQLVAELPGLPDDMRVRCRNATNLAEARAAAVEATKEAEAAACAAEATGWAMVLVAASAAEWAVASMEAASVAASVAGVAKAASLVAAQAAGAAAADTVLIQACQLLRNAIRHE